MVWKAVLIVIAVAVVACGSSEPETVGSTTTLGAATTSPRSETSTTFAPTTSSSQAATTTTAEGIDVEFSGGETIGPDVVGVALNDTVDIWVLSDIDDEMHVHGYDTFFELEAGVPFHLSFVADVPGIFEVELESGHTHLFDIEVAG